VGELTSGEPHRIWEPSDVGRDQRASDNAAAVASGVMEGAASRVKQQVIADRHGRQRADAMSAEGHALVSEHPGDSPHAR
jgi:hypothetical protein